MTDISKINKPTLLSNICIIMFPGDEVKYQAKNGEEKNNNVEALMAKNNPSIPSWMREAEKIIMRRVMRT